MPVLRDIVERCIGLNGRHEKMACHADRMVEKINKLEQLLREQDDDKTPDAVSGNGKGAKGE